MKSHTASQLYLIMSAEKNQFAHHFGVNLRTHRMRARITQEELASRSSLHRTEIGMLERGVREPMLSTTLKLASALSIQPEDLFEGIRWSSGRVNPGDFEFDDHPSRGPAM